MVQQDRIQQDKPMTDRTAKSTAVKVFLSRLAKALTNGDTENIVPMWSLPSFVIGENLTMAITSSQQIRDFFAGSRDQYNSMGIFNTYPDVQSLYWPTKNICMAEVRWPYINDKGVENGAESSMYALRIDESGEVKVLMALMKGVEGKR
jgi:hypothetical protein